jgi:SAM-dependent methyltransferase
VPNGIAPDKHPVPVGNTYDKYGSRGIERRLVENFLSCLGALLPQAAPRRILEVGVGEGMIAGCVRQRFPRTPIVAIDLPSPDASVAWRTHGLRGSFADAHKLPFADASFDLVLAIEVMEHLERPDEALREIARVATGAVVLSVPREPIWRMGNMVRRRYLDDWGNTPGHLQHWSKRSFSRFVGSQLIVEDVDSPLPWTIVAATAPPRARRRPPVRRPVVAQQPGDSDELVRPGAA